MKWSRDEELCKRLGIPKEAQVKALKFQHRNARVKPKVMVKRVMVKTRIESFLAP